MGQTLLFNRFMNKDLYVMKWILPGCFHMSCYDYCSCCQYSDTIFGTGQVPKKNAGAKVLMNESEVKRPVRRGRPKIAGLDERKKAIVIGAYSAFIELGFAQTSTTEIARRAKVSKRTIYEVFSNKKEIFSEVIKEYKALFLDLPRPENEELPLNEALFRIFRLDISQEDAKEREALLKLMTRESILFPDLSDYLYATKTLRSRELLIEWLDIQQAQGRITVKNTGNCAGMLMDIVFGALIPRRWLLDLNEDQTLTPEGRQQQLEEIKERIETVIQGIKNSI
ncbi:TetR/AcrR family transcriptional regulator [Escherichia coli]|uniref:TetR/AcrR family transcriptional regulator n=2 Tax=Escherichia coli TaxID=562 RepID=UPI00265604F9|nr:TetR/AcrR family transcriptional regulator [Escherichia coli]MDN7378386.1 TetR/AcrR family transcriptional regulator [Escherichia coli]